MKNSVIAKMSKVLKRATDEKIYVFIYRMHLHGFHGLPQILIDAILGYLTQKELSALAWLMQQYERKGAVCVRGGFGVDEARANQVVRDIPNSVVERTEGVRVDMVFNAVGADVGEAFKNIVKLRAEDVIRDFVESIAKVSQVKTYELGTEKPIIPTVAKPSEWGHPVNEKPIIPTAPIPPIPPPGEWGTPWGRVKPPVPPIPPPGEWGAPWGRVKPTIKKKFVKTKSFLPQSQVSVGPRGLDNRPAWITRGMDHDFILVRLDPFPMWNNCQHLYNTGWTGTWGWGRKW
jgi:hypothetical protein